MENPEPIKIRLAEVDGLVKEGSELLGESRQAFVRRCVADSAPPLIKAFKSLKSRKRPAAVRE